MCGKFVCGMLSGLAVGAAAATLYKEMQDKNESTKIKRKAKKLLNFTAEKGIEEMVQITSGWTPCKRS